MAAYCRPLTFRSVFLHTYTTRAAPLSPTATLSGNIRLFAAALAHNPQILNFLVHLEVNLYLPLLEPEQRLVCSQDQQWSPLFDNNTPQLKALKLNFNDLQYPGTLASSIFKFLARSQSLVSLTLEDSSFGSTGFPITTFDYIPSSAKDLTINFITPIKTRGQGVPLSPPTTQRTSLPKLESLTVISGSLSDDFLTESSDEHLLQLDLRNLKHLQLDRGVTETSRAHIIPSIQNLQCIHLGVRLPLYGQPWASTLSPNALHLHGLRYLEFATPDWRQGLSTLNSILESVSATLLQLQSSIDLPELKVSILVMPFAGFLSRHAALWKEASQQNLWPNLKTARVAAYAAFQVSGFPKTGFEEIIPLGVYGGGEAPDYRSLWEGGPCAGWRSR
jgi:hypothetical protein